MSNEQEIKLSLYQKLLEIQKEVRGLSKDKKSNNYEYVTGNKLLSFIKPLMDKFGLLLKQEVTSIENERMDYRTGIGTQYEKDKSEILSKVMMKFTWIDAETGEKDENLFGANGQNDWEKGLGSALTYAERYFILKYFHIATDEDDVDNPDRKPKEAQQPQSNTTPTTSKPQSTTDRLKVTDWLSDADYKKALESNNIETISSVGKKYDGKTVIDGKIYGMKKEYRESLLAKYNELKA